MSTSKALTLGTAIRQARKERKMTQREVAALCGVVDTYISRVEHGKHLISLTMLHRFAAAMNVKAWKILRRAAEIEAANLPPFVTSQESSSTPAPQVRQ